MQELTAAVRPTRKPRRWRSSDDSADLSARLEVHRDAPAFQVTFAAAGLHDGRGGIADYKEGIDSDDAVNLVAESIVGGVLQADAGGTGIVVVTRRTAAYSLDLAQLG